MPMKDSSVTGATPTISAYTPSNSAILPSNSAILPSNSAILPSLIFNNNSSTNAAFGFPRRERMEHWNLEGNKIISSPVSTLTEGTRSILENTLEDHIEFRRRQSSLIEQKIEADMKQQMMNKMLSSIKSGSSLNEFNEMGEPTIGGSVSLSFDGGNGNGNGNGNTIVSSSSLSQVQGGGHQSPQLKCSLASSFRPKSAAASRKRTQRSGVHNSQYHLSTPPQTRRQQHNANHAIRVGTV